MVRFEEDKLVIEIKTATPHEDWMDLHMSLCDIIMFVNRDTLVDDTFYSAVNLLSEMLPDWETSRKMGV